MPDATVEIAKLLSKWIVCKHCGAVVADERAHRKWHDKAGRHG